jgi:hypothetical protein
MQASAHGKQFISWGNIRRVLGAVMLGVTLAFVLGLNPLKSSTAAAAADEYWWQPASRAGIGPTLYRFRPDGTGVRTTYPTGSFSFGMPSGFGWSKRGNTVIMQFPSGYTDAFRITRYDRGADVLFQVGSRQGTAPLYGCRSGRMPVLLAPHLCQ